MFESLFNAFSGQPPVTTGLVLRAMPAHAKSSAHRATIPYVLLQISCDPGVDISAPMATALKVIRRPGCCREATISTLMFLTFSEAGGVDPARWRDKVADELMRLLGSRVRIVRGTLVGVVGHIGRGSTYLDGSAFIGVETLCNALFEQKYGTTVTLDLVPKEEDEALEHVH
jgi:hypothetical protein